IGLKLRQGGFASLRWPENKVLSLMDSADSLSRCYLRFTAVDRPGVLASIAQILGQNNISIASVIQKQENPRQAVPIVMLTHQASEKSFRQALKSIDALKAIRQPTVRLRLVE
ncbi:MAG TPA: ACT domain-containing protein, partial [bacterium]|nr:ACT domain-containing protein [bacterium]